MRRHLRHRLLPEIGDAGQARLGAHRVAPPAGDPRASAVTVDYLRRAGVSIVDAPEGAAPDAPGVTAEAVAALAGRPELEEAAAFLAGAFAAVEAIKAALEVGRPGTLEGVALAGAPNAGEEPAP